MKPVVEEIAHPSLELQISEKHRLHLNSEKQDSEIVHNVVLVCMNGTEYSTSSKRSDNSGIVYKDRNISNKLPQVIPHESTTKQKRTIKIPKTKSDDFLWI